MNHGVFVEKQATGVSTPVTAECSVPFYVGTAPVQTAEDPVGACIPCMGSDWSDAVKHLGYSDDWDKYTLCEAMYSHYKLYGAAPAVFCNVLDITDTESVAAADMAVTDHKILLPLEALNNSSLVVKPSGGTGSAFVKDEDYAVYYDGGKLVVEALEDGDCYSAATLNVAYVKVDPTAITTTEIANGIEGIELCMTRLGRVPDIIVAPKWSSDSVVAALMDTKAGAINGLFCGKAFCDIDCTSSGADSYDDVLTVKTTANMNSPRTVSCWPMLSLGDMKFHISVQLAGLCAAIDSVNGDPYESPSNKGFKCDGAILADGTEVNLTHTQATYLNSIGVVTALNFMSSGWVAWGNYTSCYPGNTDVKDYFIPVGRMLDWVGNSLIRTFWSKLDRPMTKVLIDSIIDSANIWLNGLVGIGHLLGARVEMIDAENPLTNLMAGIIKLHVYLTPPSPAQEIHWVLEYDAAYASAAFAA